MLNLRIAMRLFAMSFAFGLIAVGQISCRDSFGTVASARERADKAAALRLSVGLRQIGPTWICFRSIDGLDEWIQSKNIEAAEKTVQYDVQGKLLWEEDSYPSGIFQKWDDQTVGEELSIHYDYLTKKAEIHYTGNDPIIKSFVVGASGLPNSDVFATADKILKGWKISRL